MGKWRRRGKRRGFEALERRVLLSVIYVDHSAPGTRDGTTWDNAYTDLRLALLASHSGDELHVAAGTYAPQFVDDPESRSPSFQLKSGVSVLGGYAGSGEANPDDRNWATHPTILSGYITDPPFYFSNVFHVVTAIGVDSTALLEGFTIRDGRADYIGGGDEIVGGGLLDMNSSPTLRHCFFTNNTAGGLITATQSVPGKGGAIYNLNSSPALDDCTFSGNVATGGNNQANGDPTIHAGYGGAIYNNASSNPAITNCIFTGNLAGTTTVGYNPQACPGYGGAINNDNSSPVLTACTFNGNKASSWVAESPGFPPAKNPYDAYGGAIMSSDGGTTTLNDCTFLNNSAIANPDQGYSGIAWGGAVYASGATQLTLANCTFQNNTASAGSDANHGNVAWGGAVYVSDHTLLAMAGCTFKHNNASGLGGAGGACWIDSTSLALSANVFALNSCQGTYGDGGALRIESCIGTIANSTFDQNSARGALFSESSGGGAINDSDSNVQYSDCTFTQNLNSISSTNAAAWSRGGAFLDAGSQSNFLRCQFTGNQATTPAGTAAGAEGGALYIQNASPSLIDCTFTTNSVNAPGTDHGGAVANYNSHPLLRNCIFRGNLVGAAGGGGGGGAVSNDGVSTAILQNCDIVNNNGGAFGGAICDLDASTAYLYDCTLTANHVHVSAGTDRGGGIYNDSSSSAILQNSILWHNLASFGLQIFDVGTTTSAHYCDIEGLWPGSGIISADPLFFTPVAAGDSDFGNQRLRSSSPAIDRGDNSVVPADLTTDLAGLPRIVDFPTISTPGGAIVDMGAYEAPVNRLAIAGPAGNGNFYLVATATQLNIWNAPNTNGPADWALDLSATDSVEIDTSSSFANVIVDVSGGTLDGRLIDFEGGSATYLTATAFAGQDLDAQADQLALGGMTLASGAPLASVRLDGPAGGSVSLGQLIIGDGARISVAPSKNLVLQASQLTTQGSGTLDLSNNALVINGGDPSTIGSFGGSVYTGVTGLLASGRNHGAWNGPGIVTSMSAAAGGSYVTLAVANAGDVMGASGGVFHGLTLDPSATIVKYTYGGDANLDGKINVDDYIRIDSGIAVGATGWSCGDFNLDGKVNIDDYTQFIDVNIGVQGPAL